MKSYFFDSSKVFISRSDGFSTTNNTFTTPANCKYIDIQYNLTNNNFDTYMLEAGDTATSYEPYTGGIPAPNPDYPMKVKTVKGYRNLFDKDNANVEDLYIHGSEDMIYTPSTLGRKLIYISCKANTNYTIIKATGTYFRVASTSVIPADRVSTINKIINDTGNKITINSGANANYLAVNYYNSATDTLTEQEILDSIMIVEGTEELPYVPYGTNWIYTKVTNGTDTNYYTLPLNDNEIAGIGNYKDEYIVDKNGHCWLNKKTKKIVLNGTEADNIYSVFVSRETTTYFNVLYYDFVGYNSSTLPQGFCNLLSPQKGDTLFAGGVEGFTFTTSNYARISLLNN